MLDTSFGLWYLIAMVGPIRRISTYQLAQLLGDWQNGPSPLYQRLARRMAQLLSDGRVAPGVRLPAQRQLADQLKVSRTTVIRSYNLLADQALLDRHVGSGCTTRLPSRGTGKFSPWSAGSRWRGPQDSLIDLTKASMQADEQFIGKFQESAANNLDFLIGHQGYDSLGLECLREEVAQRYELRGVPTTPDQILITGGAQQGIDLLTRMLVSQRETVVVESPTYAGTLDSLRLAGARMVGLDVANEPWSLHGLESLLDQTWARLVYFTPDFHNPTGRLMPDVSREQLVQMCKRRGATLIIDETLADVALDIHALPLPIAAHDPSETVISVGSLSKSLWAGLRVAWIRASPRQIAGLATIKTVASLGSALVEQVVSASLLPELDRHLAARRPQLIVQRDVLLRAVEQLGWNVEKPHGGLSAWVKLPQGSSTLLSDVSYRKGVAFIPGPRLSPDGALDRFLRLPFALSSEMITEAVTRLESAWNEVRHNTRRHQVTQVV